MIFDRTYVERWRLRKGSVSTYTYQRSDEYQYASSSAINEAQNITIR